MDRRTFVLLTGGVSSRLIRPPSTALHRPPPGGVAGTGRLRFELDDHNRWSLWYYGDGSPVPVVRGAEIVAWVGDQPLTLAELEDSTVGNRRPPGGDAVVVRGRAAGVWVEAELLTAGGASTPQASVTVTVFPDRYLPTVRGVRFFQLPHADVLAGDGPLAALVNGAHSADPTRMVAVGAPEAEGLASHAAVGLTRGSRGLAIAFDAGEPGEARVQLSRDALEAVSDWLPARPLRPEGDASHMRLCFHPEGDGLEALRALFVPSSPVDQERLAQAVAPAGWCTRAEWSGTVAEADVITNLNFSAAHFDRRFFRHIELDDGYQQAIGAWDPNARFPHGHAWLTDQIHARGLGWQDLRARRRPPQGAAVVVRSGPPRRARMGLRLPARRPVALGDPRHSALRRPYTRRSLPRRLGRDSRRPRHRGIPARERGAVAARRRARQWDADRAGRGRQLVGDPITGTRRGPAELLSPLDLAERPRLPCGARSAVAGGRRGVGIGRRGYRRAYPAWRQPAESATRSPPAAAAHAPGRSRGGPRHRGRCRRARHGARDRGRR